jgi:D-xylulose kinase
VSQFLGLDVGTQGTKGLVLDVERGAVAGRAARSYGMIEGLPPGAAEQHPHTWWQAVREVVRELVRSGALVPARLSGIGVSGQQHGFVALDAAGEPLCAAKLWCDTSTAAEARELSRLLGRRVPVGYTASKVLNFARSDSRAWARLATILLPHDYVDFRLTGQAWMEAGDASGTGFFDPVVRTFSAADAARVAPGLVERLPALVPPDRVAALLAAGPARELGLPPGVPVAPGGGDNMMSAIGSGAVRPGVCVVSLGTSGTVFTWSARPVVDPSGLVATFCDSTGAWLPLLCVMNATGVTSEVERAFSPAHDLDSLTRAAAQEPVGCEGLLFLPYLAGERVPDLPEATGTLLGLRAGALTPGRLFRAALEGTSLNLAWGVERMRRLGLAIESVNLVGGGARNPLWRAILAATLGVPVIPLAESESAALGAALQAAWVVRRETERELTIAEVVAPWIRPEGETVVPRPAAVREYAVLLARFCGEVRRLYDGVG